MALLNDLDDAAKRIQLEREKQKEIEQAKKEAAEKAKAENPEEHQKRFEQGLL